MYQQPQIPHTTQPYYTMHVRAVNTHFVRLCSHKELEIFVSKLTILWVSGYLFVLDNTPIQRQPLSHWVSGYLLVLHNIPIQRQPLNHWVSDYLFVLNNIPMER